MKVKTDVVPADVQDRITEGRVYQVEQVNKEGVFPYGHIVLDDGHKALILLNTGCAWLSQGLWDIVED